jgi:hypothetical protein
MLDPFRGFRAEPHALGDQPGVACDAHQAQAVLVRVLLGEVGGQHDGLALARAHLPHGRSHLVLEELRAIDQKQLLLAHGQEIAAPRTTFVMVIGFQEEVRDARIEGGVPHLVSMLTVSMTIGVSSHVASWRSRLIVSIPSISRIL